MKAIITGCEGFIGKALAANLINRGVQVISIDRRSGIEAGDYFNSADLSGIDCVFHLAAQTSVFNRNQSDIIHDNIEAFVSVCNACRRYGVKLVYASSSTAAPGNATSLYGISKRFNEDYAQCYCPDATGVRFHNVYGPQPRQGTLLWYMFNDDRVKLYNEGRNVSTTIRDSVLTNSERELYLCRQKESWVITSLCPMSIQRHGRVTRINARQTAISH